MMGIVMVLILALIGAGLIVAGAFMVAGTGIALLVAGALVLGAAKIISRGVNG